MGKKWLNIVPTVMAICLCLTACGEAGGTASDPPAGKTTLPTAPADNADEAAIIEKLGVDYRENWDQYIMKFDNDSCDYWFIREGDVYHAFFLEFIDKDGERQSHIAHATSTDFLHWEYQGIVLYGYGDGWETGALATGSVVKMGDTYYMLYTAHSRVKPGLALAKSNDLYTWERVGNGSIIPSGIQLTAAYEGESHRCQVLADPYIYPEPIDGWYYAYVNSWATDRPKNSRGCQLMLRTQDMLHWEPYKIATLTDDLDRLETSDVWEHNGKWYMSFGGRRVDPAGGDFDDVEGDNYIYMADSFDGPYLKQSWSTVVYPTQGNYYIQKTLTDPFGDEVILPMLPYAGVSWPFYIRYGADGAISFDIIFR